MDVTADVDATVDAGTVRVGVRVRTPVEVTWLALRDPVRLGKWFGELDQPWLVGRTGRVDFGDGDFFVVTPTEIAEERFAAFEWSFLGVGPVNQIRWTVRALPDGTEVLVEDHDPNRGAAEAHQMVQGWTDFLGRLASFLQTGEASRYGWRADIDGSVDLPGGHFLPLRLNTLYRWLPIASDGFQPRWFFIVDEEGPRRFPVDSWQLEPDTRLTFSVGIPETEVSTECIVVVDQVGDGLRLRFAHTGWGLPGLSSARGLALRRRFAMTWTAALSDARRLAASGG